MGGTPEFEVRRVKNFLHIIQKLIWDCAVENRDFSDFADFNIAVSAERRSL